MAQKFSARNSARNLITGINCIAAAALLVVVVWIALGFWRDRQIPFDADAWNHAGIASRYDIRFRMAQDLALRLKKDPRLSSKEVLALLGEPTGGAPDDRMMRYPLGSKFVGPLPFHEYYLFLQFDEQNVISTIQIVPE